MKLLSLTVRRFGKHEDLHLDFSAGLSSFCFPNGWGKSTLLAFIKVMFFGPLNDRSRSIEEKERDRYMPWGENTAGGQIVYETEGVAYRLERTFGKKPNDDTVHLYEAETGKEIPFSDPLGESLFQIDADGFERTVFLSEKQLRGKNDNPSVAARLTELTGAEGDIGDLESAEKSLEKQRKELSKTGDRGRIGEIAKKISDKRNELAEIEIRLKTLSDLESEREEKQKELKEKRAQKEALAAQYAKLPPKNKRASLLAEIEREMARTEQNRCTLKAAVDFLGEVPPTVEEIRKAEEAKRHAETEKEKADAITSGAEAAKENLFSHYPIDDGKIEKMKANEAEAGKLPYAIALTTVIVIAAFLGLFLPRRNILFVVLGIALAGGICVLSYFIFIGKMEEARGELRDFLAPYRGLTSPVLTLSDLQKAYEEYLRDALKRQEEKEKRDAHLAAAAEYEKEAAAFLSRFPLCDDPYPFETVRRHLLEVSALTDSIHESDRHIAALRAEADSDVYVLAEGLYADLEAKIAAVDEAISAFEAGITAVSAKIDGMEDLESKKETILSAIDSLEEEKAQKEKELTVIKKTQALLSLSAERLTAAYLGPTQNAFSSLMKAIDGEGIYHLSTSFEITKEEKAETHDAVVFSKGTRDLFDFALRLSLVDALYTAEKPFLLLDDPLAALDDAHFAKAADVLRETAKTYQILYFTCTEKRMIK